MKPISGSGARGLMLESFHHFGVDSFVGKLTSTLQGATDTTFYIIAVYFGAVSIRKTRYAITAGLIADLAGIIAAIFIAYLFFGGSVGNISNQEITEKFANCVENSNMKNLNKHFSNDLYLIDYQLDTISNNPSSFINELNSIANYKLVWQKEINNEEHMVKFENKNDTKSYKLFYKNGKITKVEYLGFFKYD